MMRLKSLVLAAVIAAASSPFAFVSAQANASKVLDYGKAMGLSTLFYEAQRSGKLPANNRVPWRGDSAMNDGSDHGLDLTGGWYDAGDHIKFNFPMAFSATTLMWGILEYHDSWKGIGQLDVAMDMVKWPLDYILKCHPDENTYYVQVGQGDADHQYWGSAEGMGGNRPSYFISPQNPGTEYAAEGAAALAAGAILFKDDAPYSSLLKMKARSLFDLADKYRGSSEISNPFYKSYTGYWDELAWAAVWLYKATGDKTYLKKAEEEYYDECCSNTHLEEFSWDRKSSAAQLLLYRITKNEKYADGFKVFMDSWINEVPRTPRGLAFKDQWAPNRYASNAAMIALVAADYGVGDKDEYREFAKSQIDYVLKAGGDVNEETGEPHYSYLIGFGEKYPRAPHHRGASCGNGWCGCGSDPQPNILYGALVGGPGKDDDYSDSCQDYVHNEVATDYNAGFTSALAGMLHLVKTHQLPK